MPLPEEMAASAQATTERAIRLPRIRYGLGDPRLSLKPRIELVKAFQNEPPIISGFGEFTTVESQAGSLALVLDQFHDFLCRRLRLISNQQSSPGLASMPSKPTVVVTVGIPRANSFWIRTRIPPPVRMGTTITATRA